MIIHDDGDNVTILGGPEKEPEKVERLPRLCACGCGLRFTPGSDNHIFLDLDHGPKIGRKEPERAFTFIEGEKV